MHPYPTSPRWPRWWTAMIIAIAVALDGAPTAEGEMEESDDAFLITLERSGVAYFIEAADPDTGLVSDRAPAAGGSASPIASVAATGFGLTALCIGAEHGWVARDTAEAQVRRTLKTLLEHAPVEHGYFYHWMDRSTACRGWNSEVSSIDTALVVAGVLSARAYFDKPDIREMATRIYERVEWSWMENGRNNLSMGWLPETGFIASRWADYSELKMLYLLGIGSPTHPLDPASWDAWKREPVIDYKGKHFISAGPLFTHQYSEAWFDFRGRADAYADYWVNSVLATEANREFCMDFKGVFPTYSEVMWGASASDRAGGYAAWGGPPESGLAPDGTVVPCAVAGSLPFDPRHCIQTLRHMQAGYGTRIWGRYGFVDAFNPITGWAASDAIGIDVGISVIMAENARTGNVWKWFMANPEPVLAMRRAGFTPSPLPQGSRSSLLAPQDGLVLSR